MCSFAYKVLFDPEKNVYQAKWTRAMWSIYCMSCCILSMNADAFKAAILYMLVSDIISRATVPSSCNNIKLKPRSRLHTWWSCPDIQPFWKELHCLISTITTYTPDYNPAQFLLHHTSLSHSIYNRSLIGENVYTCTVAQTVPSDYGQLVLRY